jgi:hypothetical protein
MENFFHKAARHYVIFLCGLACQSGAACPWILLCLGTKKVCAAHVGAHGESFANMNPEDF